MLPGYAGEGGTVAAKWLPGIMGVNLPCERVV